MKVLCDRERLREALTIVTPALPARTTNPLLSAMLLEASGTSLSVSTTDLEVAIRYTLSDVQVDQQGSCAIPAMEASEFVRDLGDATVTLGVGRGTFRIQGKDDLCELSLADAGEFPAFPEAKGGAEFTIAADALAELLERTVFAAAKELGRFAMNGVRLEIEKDLLRVIATDGRRLSFATKPLENPVKPAVQATLPTKAVAQFQKVLQGSRDPVTLSLTEDKATLHTKSATIVTRLLEGEFPRYQAVIPKEGKNFAEFDPRMLAQKIRLVSHICDAHQALVKFKFSGSSLTLTCSASQRGEARAELPATFRGSQGEVSFNPEFVVDGLKVSRRESVRLEFNEKGSPGRFLLNEGHDYVVMPVVND